MSSPLSEPAPQLPYTNCECATCTRRVRLTETITVKGDIL